MKKQNGAYMTCRAYNGRCVLAWLSDALIRFHHQQVEAGRVVGQWVREAINSGQISEWPTDELLAPTMAAVIHGCYTYIMYLFWVLAKCKLREIARLACTKYIVHVAVRST